MKRLWFIALLESEVFIVYSMSFLGPALLTFANQTLILEILDFYLRDPANSSSSLFRRPYKYAIWEVEKCIKCINGKMDSMARGLSYQILCRPLSAESTLCCDAAESYVALASRLANCDSVRFFYNLLSNFVECRSNCCCRVYPRTSSICCSSCFW